MLSLAMFFYIGVALNAPTWYWALWGVYIVTWLIRCCLTVVKAVLKLKEE